MLMGCLLMLAGCGQK
ncbi:lipoprotein [Pediococcus pentosaceus]|nr:lipoprotein [Pediococcus pentosaceus]